MSTIWTLIDVCLSDARRAEELVSSSAARRELRLHPDSALAQFSLTRRSTNAPSRRPRVMRANAIYATVEARAGER